jgi:hypothetical protein
VINHSDANVISQRVAQHRGGRPPKFIERQRDEIKRIALSRPEDHEQPISTWSLSKLADYLVDKRAVEDISHERLRTILREQGVSFQRMKTWKESTDPDYEQKKERVLDLYALADGKRELRPDDPDDILCVDEFGPLNLQPHPGRQWACRGGHVRRRRRRATFHRSERHPAAVRRLRPAGRPPLWAHQAAQTPRRVPRVPALRSLVVSRAPATGDHPGQLQPAPDDQDRQARRRLLPHPQHALVYVPNNTWLNRIEAQFTGLRYFARDGTDHATHQEQGRAIRRHISWRNRNPHDRHLRKVVDRANVA